MRYSVAGIYKLAVILKKIMAEKEKTKKNPTCGIIMPISLIENCSPEHWADVLGIIKDVCNITGFIPNLVSDADDIGVIHNRIIENIYSSDIVICDVSCKNANVMFELGMRLAFDKPTIIIKDDLTGYSFDTSLIEHLEYPRDLRFTSILKFKENLSKKLLATHEKATNDPNYSTFLKNFGKYKIAHLEDREITSETYILSAIEDLKRDVRVIRNYSINDSNENEIFRKLNSENRNISLSNNNLEAIRRMNIKKILNSEGENALFKDKIQEYLKNNKISKARDIQSIIPDMILELEKNEELRKIAGSSSHFEKLVMENMVW